MGLNVQGSRSAHIGTCGNNLACCSVGGLEVQQEMRRRFTRSLGTILLLILSTWGGVSPRVWCSAPGGHAALESLFERCCQHTGQSCLSSETPDSTVRADVPFAQAGATTSLQFSAGDRCTDSLLRAMPGSTSASGRMVTSPVHPGGVLPLAAPRLHTSPRTASAGFGPPDLLPIRPAPLRI